MDIFWHMNEHFVFQLSPFAFNAEAVFLKSSNAVIFYIHQTGRKIANWKGVHLIFLILSDFLEKNSFLMFFDVSS